jgi:hypothetical protein
MKVIVTRQNKKGFYDIPHELKCTINAYRESTEKTDACLKFQVKKTMYNIALGCCP